MDPFSQRQGIKPPKSVMQVRGMDQDLRNSLWNALDLHYLWKVEGKTHDVEGQPELYTLGFFLWRDHFKKPLDTMPREPRAFKQELREYFFNCEWSEVYDLIEFIAKNHLDNSVNEKFVGFANSMLERELSGYRFIGGKIAPITSKEEISEIEEAIEGTRTLIRVKEHLETALALFSDKKSPDYRNSIKESISAVEAICRMIIDKENATLGQALKVVKDKVGLHSALQQAFGNLYGYTSDAEGIRHALLNEPNLDFGDAKFMLVSCSAFINYLKLKALKAGITLEAK